MEPKYFSSFQNAKSNGICVPTVFDSTFIEPSLDSTVVYDRNLVSVSATETKPELFLHKPKLSPILKSTKNLVQL